jgi:DNA-binding transcriptional LysR family regulator
VKGGTKVWREPLVWASSDGYQPEEPLSLVLSPQPCIYRSRALAALDRAKRSWHISYTSPSLAGTLAAVKAGFGITVLPAHMLPAGLHPIRKEWKLPHLADAEVALMKKDELSEVAEMFVEHIVQSLENMKL